ncbi:MAG: acyltransferase [Paludibacteraceae bacterium]|nr:acyltransferase [Paludibacteraceae bacterium]
MKYPAEFNDIRCFDDSEVAVYLPKLLAEPTVQQVLGMLLGPELMQKMQQAAPSLQTVYDFQSTYIIGLLKALMAKTTAGVQLLGAEKLDKSAAYLFMTNHRDIVLDSAFLNAMLYFNGFQTTQIGIGNNLLIKPWIEWAVRLNKSFVVRRDGGVREQLLISKHMSAYMRYVLTQVNESIWIAQREGRAKDSNDITAPAIIKMLNMSGEGTFVEKLRALNIAPVAITYEYDPCDYLKAKEYQQKRDDANYKKQPADDLLNMQTGIMSYKGRISYVVAGPLEVPDAWNDVPRAMQADVAAAAIDKMIHANYQLFPNNYVAADLLSENQDFADKYTAEDKQTFVAYIEKQLQKIDLPNRDDAFLRSKMYQMYANPVYNQQKAWQ